MSVVSVKEIPRRGGDLANFDTNTERNWRIKVDTPNETQFTIYPQVVGVLPIYLEPHPDNLLCTLRRISIRQEEDKGWRWWIATAFYSAQPLSQDDQDRTQIENPLLRPRKIRWTTKEYTRAVEKDRDGEAYLNSAGDEFDPPAEMDDANWVIAITKNVASVPTNLKTYKMATNADSIEIGGLIWDEDELRISGIDISEQMTENGVDFHVLTLLIETNEDTWKVSTPDRGLRKKDGTDRVQITLPDDDGNEIPVTSPVLLDGSGGVLADPSPSNAVFRDAYPYRQRNYAALFSVLGI